MTKTNKLIIGAGAAGLFAAVTAAKAGKSVLLFEKNKYPGRKLNITGKGRCNLTNNCSVPEFLENTVTNGKFLYGAINALSPADTIAFFESGGLKTVTQRGRRVFPASEKASDVTDFLVSECRKAGVKFIHEKVISVLYEDGRVLGVKTDRATYNGDAVIIATGGLSYPQTGSDGDGYRWAKAAGHSIIPPVPSLVPLVAQGDFCRRCMGLSLKNVRLTFKKGSKELYSEEGEMLFTHFGVSGPVILSASAYLSSKYPVDLHIDLKPALTEEMTDKRVLRDFCEDINKDFCNSLSKLLPQKLIEPIISLSGIDPHKKVNEITKQERAGFVSLLKDLKITLTGPRSIDEAIVTSGGVCVREVNPKTTESKLVRGLYFAGEVLDVDAYTGGYNLQIAFSTGYLAGLNC